MARQIDLLLQDLSWKLRAELDEALNGRYVSEVGPVLRMVNSALITLRTDARRLADEKVALQYEIHRLTEELDDERMRHAACGVVALSNTPETAAKARDMLPKYRSASVKEVERAVDAEMKYREDHKRLEWVLPALRILAGSKDGLDRHRAIMLALANTTKGLTDRDMIDAVRKNGV